MSCWGRNELLHTAASLSLPMLTRPRRHIWNVKWNSPRNVMLLLLLLMRFPSFTRAQTDFSVRACVCASPSPSLESELQSSLVVAQHRAHSARIYNNECANWLISVFVLPLNRAVSNRIHIGLRIHALRRPRRDWLKWANNTKFKYIFIASLGTTTTATTTTTTKV